jgi:hypothetical protein
MLFPSLNPCFEYIFCCTIATEVTSDNYPLGDKT